MSALLLAQTAFGTTGIVSWVIWIIIIAAVIAVGYIILTYAFKVTIPPWIPMILWVLLGAAVAILAIRFLVSLA